MQDTGDFSFDFAPNADLIAASGVADNTEGRASTSLLANFHRFMLDPKTLRGRRNL